VETSSEIEKKDVNSGLFSHPFVYIEDHVNRCLELANFFLTKNVPLLSEEFKTVIQLAVALHDFGKTTAYFQEYIRAKMEGKPFKSPYFEKKKLTDHALLGGVYAFYISKNLLQNELLPFFVFVACRRHHTDLKTFLLEASDVRDEKNFLKKQIETIEEDRVNIFFSKLSLPEKVKTALFFKKDEFLLKLSEILADIEEYRKYFRKTLKGECRTTMKDYFIFQYIFSLLLDADKTEAGAKPFNPKRFEIPPEVVEKYKKTKLKQQRKIDNLREKAFKEVLSKEIDLAHRLYSITLPTGMGKTLTGFAFTLKLREKIVKEKGYIPRIIYSLPFLSIIDQNEQVLKEVISTKIEVKSSILLKHHHLSDKSYDEYEYAVSRLLTEGWNAEVVITTFVQLFHTLFAWRNSESRRFNKLAGSIILIDEVQALPHKYWHLVRNTLREISEKLGTYVILMTATQPYLLPESKELVSSKYFKLLDRINFRVETEQKTIEEFVSSLELDSNRTYLFITNTVFSSKELYKKLKEKTNEEIGYLSTTITPYERKERIRKIKEGKYRLVVSTQLVEAGVDIDFDVVFRDFAPMDSLIQSAGRCNRNMEKGKGEFVMVKLVDGEGRPFWSFIYDPILVKETEKLLKGKSALSEPQFTELCEEYFKNLWENKISAGESKKIEKAIKCFKFSGKEEAVKDFKLVKDEPYKSDVFVEINEEANLVWEEAKEILRKLRSRKIDLFAAKEEFEKLKPQFYNFVISVDVRKNKPLEDKELGIYYIPQEMLLNYYDLETGFITNGSSYGLI